LILPTLFGLAMKAVAPRWAARLVPVGGKVATFALVIVIVSTFGANLPELIGLLKTGAIVAGVLLVVGAFAVGYLLGRRDRSVVLGLGTAQRNIAAAMVIASRDFTNPDILVMVTASALAGLLVLFPLAWLLSRRTPRVGLPTAAPA
jgi:BASS family bile acid:Na+ symporter